MDDPWPFTPETLIIISLLILASGVFTLFDSALVSCRKSRLQNAGKLLEAVANTRPWLLTVYFWSTIFRVSGVFWAASFVIRHTPGFAALVVTAAVLTVAISLLGDIIPRTAGRAAPERIAAALLPVMYLFALPLRPFIFLAARAAAFLRSAADSEGDGYSMTEDELHLALVEGEKSGIVESQERTMVEGVFYLGDRPVGAFMTHRSEIQWLDANAPMEEIRAKTLEYRSQRCFPVADGNLDEVIGAAYLEDIILAASAQSPQTLRAIMKKAQFVPETMSALKAFESFKGGEANFLFVMDEYGGFAGIISIRDLVEEIVGELASPRKKEEPIIRQEDGVWLADGSVNIDDAAKAFGLPALASEHSDYHTLAGFVLSLAGELPQVGNQFTFQGFCFQVTGMDGNRIDKLRVWADGGTKSLSS